MAKPQIFDAALETVNEGVRNLGTETVEQTKKFVGAFESQMLYGTTDLIDPQKFEETKKRHELIDTQAIAAARNKNAELINGRGMINLENKSNTPVKKDGTTPPQPNRKIVMEHHSTAENLGIVREDEVAQIKKRQEQEAEQKELDKKRAEQASLDNPIEAPMGRQTGVSFGRKKPRSKMTKPPVIGAETRGSNTRE